VFLPSLTFSVTIVRVRLSAVESLACGKLDGLPICESTYEIHADPSRATHFVISHLRASTVSTEILRSPFSFL